MTPKEYIDNYCRLKKDYFPMEPGNNSISIEFTDIITKYNDIHISSVSKGKNLEDDPWIKFLAENQILTVHSTFEKNETGYKQANYGFSEKLQEWVGWSHRGWFGFKIGSTVSPGDVAYNPANKKDFKQETLNFNKDPEYYKKIWIDNETDEGFDLYWAYNDKVPNEDLRGTVKRRHYRYPEKFGRGAWKAETMDDARQMAMDFANNIN